MKNENKVVELRVYDIINTEKAISTEDGNKIFERIDQSFHNGENVVVDFSGIVMLISAFLNAAIGQLYSKYKSSFLNKTLTVNGMSNEDLVLLKKVIDRAKNYFRDKNTFEESIKLNNE
jgi:hypothetical protein